MSDDIFDKVIDYIDNMSDDDLFNLIKECEEYPEFCFAICNDIRGVKNEID